MFMCIIQLGTQSKSNAHLRYYVYFNSLLIHSNPSNMLFNHSFCTFHLIHKHVSIAKHVPIAFVQHGRVAEESSSYS